MWISVIQSLNNMTPRRREGPGGHKQWRWESVEERRRLARISIHDCESNGVDNRRRIMYRRCNASSTSHREKDVQETEVENSEDWSLQKGIEIRIDVIA